MKRKRPDAPADERPSRARRWGGIALRVLVIVVVILAIRAWQQRDVARGMAPDFAAPTLEGETVSIAGLRGQPVLVHFWATWCGVCNAMDGNIESLLGDHAVVTVASQSGGPAAVARHLEEEELRLPVVLDPDGRLARSYGVSAFPTSFVLGPDGRIRHTEVGYTTTLGLRARLWLAGL